MDMLQNTIQRQNQMRVICIPANVNTTPQAPIVKDAWTCSMTNRGVQPQKMMHMNVKVDEKIQINIYKILYL